MSFIFIVFFIFVSCSNEVEEPEGVFARVGEKTLTYIEKLSVKDSNIGVASKDSSEVFINNSQISRTDSCISVYNKKDEFDGGRINISNFSCLNSNKKVVKDDFSIVKIEKEI